MNKLHFLTAGMPIATDNRGYKKAFELLSEYDLDGIELEFVYGVKMAADAQILVKNLTQNNKFIVTAHGPYFINLNSKEDEKKEASVTRILDTARMGYKLGAYSITFHAAFYLGDDKEKVYKTVEQSISRICTTLENENINIWVRPETTGKATQWGSLEEIVRLSKSFKNVLPCVDFSHLHARYAGVSNTYDEFAKIFEYIGSELGNFALENFHGHLAGIAYGPKGEKNHLNLDESDMNYKDLMKAFKDFNVKGVLVCESPNIEGDAMMLKKYYHSL